MLDTLHTALTAALDKLEPLVFKARKPSRAYRELRRIAETAEPDIRRAFLSAVGAVRDGTSIAVVREALATGDIDEATRLIPWQKLGEPKMHEQFREAMTRVYRKAGEASVRMVPGDSQFTIVDPRAISAVNQIGFVDLAGNMIDGRVVEISNQTIDGLRATMRQVFEEGLPAQQAAALIRPQIGLHSQWSTAVNNYRQRLLDEGRLSRSQVNTFTDQYARKLTQARAMNIARTEAQAAAAAGQRAGWEQSAEEGDFDRETAQREWVASPNACPVCASYDGHRVGFDEPFDAGIMDPPDPHPGCTCTVVLVVE